jgi:N-sulfoglucosamine sulfohydrolase
VARDQEPSRETRNVVNDALVSWVDIVPTILDFAAVPEPEYDLQIGLTPVRDQMEERHGLHGRSFLPVLHSDSSEGWDEVFASHTFHEIQMYYPMRVVRGRRYKLIWNIAHGLEYPSAADLWESPTWQRKYREGPTAMYGPRTVECYLNRPEFELFDIEADPLESTNLAEDSRYAEVLDALKKRIHAFQRDTQDPWLLKWTYE